jgi:hypothetical protein
MGKEERENIVKQETYKLTSLRSWKLSRYQGVLSMLHGLFPLGCLQKAPVQSTLSNQLLSICKQQYCFKCKRASFTPTNTKIKILIFFL